MNMWEAIVLIVIAVMVARVLRGRHMSRHRGLDHQDGARQVAQAGNEAELRREVEELRKRIAVLERIATDAHSSEGRQSKAIAAEIESLRDS
jgi:uncharacterized protein YlxW (UPF0749 family)